MEAKNPFWELRVKKIWKEERRKQVNVTCEGKRVANQEIFTMVEMALKVGPYHEICSQVHRK